MDPREPTIDRTSKRFRKSRSDFTDFDTELQIQTLHSQSSSAVSTTSVHVLGKLMTASNPTGY